MNVRLVVAVPGSAPFRKTRYPVALVDAVQVTVTDVPLVATAWTFPGADGAAVAVIAETASKSKVRNRMEVMVWERLAFRRRKTWDGTAPPASAESGRPPRENRRTADLCLVFSAMAGTPAPMADSHRDFPPEPA